MSYRVRFTRAARDDLRPLYTFLLDQDVRAARRARNAIAKGIEFLRAFPFSCRKASPENLFLRELVISCMERKAPAEGMDQSNRSA